MAEGLAWEPLLTGSPAGRHLRASSPSSKSRKGEVLLLCLLGATGPGGEVGEWASKEGLGWGGCEGPPWTWPSKDQTVGPFAHPAPFWALAQEGGGAGAPEGGGAGAPAETASSWGRAPAWPYTHMPPAPCIHCPSSCHPTLDLRVSWARTPAGSSQPGLGGHAGARAEGPQCGTRPRLPGLGDG